MSKHLGDVDEILKLSPELNNYTADRFHQTYEFLTQEGFSKNNFGLMIAQHPKLLSMRHSSIYESIQSWRTFQFGERNTLKLLEKFPELIALPVSNELLRKVQTIKQFVGGGSNFYKLLFNSPAVLTQSLPDINEKIDYFQNVMKIEASEVYNSEAFSQDILTIKTRHIFLKRLGLYVDKKSRDPDAVSKNMKLSLITDTSDKRFATKICHVTLDEFEVFQELYQKELEDEVEDLSSDEENYGTDKEVHVEGDWMKH